MSGFSNLPQALDEGRALTPLTAEQVKFEQEKQSDLDALSIVLQDVTVGEQYLGSKQLPTEWARFDDIYRAFVPNRTWGGASDKARANLSMPVVLESIEALLPQAHMAFFSDPQPFTIDPRGRTSAAAARAFGKVAKWAIDCSGFEEEIRKCLKSSLLYGQGVCKWGWKSGTRKKKVYTNADDGNVSVTEKDYEIAEPTVEWVDLRNLIVDAHAGSQDCRRSARFMVHQKFIDADELDAMRDDGTYKNIPTREELKYILTATGETTKDRLQSLKQFQTWRESQKLPDIQPASSNPLKNKLELLEYWTDDRVVTVLQSCIVIRNEENEFGCKPFVSCAFIDVLNSFYGFGVSKLVEGEQRLQSGIANAWIDSLALKLNPSWYRKKGVNTRTSNLENAPGKVHSLDGEIEPLPVEDISQQAMVALEASSARASRRVGANFGQEMPNQALRTAEGVQAFTSGVQVKLQYFINQFANMVFVPVIEKFIELCKDNLTPTQIKEILTDFDAQAYQGDVLDLYNGQYKIGVLSSTKLAGRRAMQALVPLYMQMFGQPGFSQLMNVQGKKVDMAEFVQGTFDLTGYPGTDIIVDMTPEDLQRMQMSNPAVVTAQAKQQQAAVDHQNQLDQIDRKGDVQAGVAAVKTALKHGEPQKPLATSPTVGQ
jgi:hypothetical protein